MNLDTGAAVDMFPLNFGPDGAEDGRFYVMDSAGCFLDGGGSEFQGYNEDGLTRSLNVRLTSAHKVLCNARKFWARDIQICTCDPTVVS